MSEEQTVAVESFVQDSERLLRVFSYWPSFHDAEIINFHLWRGNVDPKKGLYQFPVLTLDLHHWEITKELNSAGYYVLRYHTRTTLTFRDVQSVQMDGFNYQNAIMSLFIKQLQREEKPSPLIFVEIEAAFGIQASFTCLSAEVTSAVPCSDTGEPLG